MYETIDYTLRDAIARITLNRPDAGNALSITMLDELYDAALRCDHDPAVRAVLMTGAGRSFSVGGDLNAFMAAGEEAGSLVARMANRFHAMVSTFSRMDKALVVAVNGTAAGGGFSLFLCGDLVLASEEAKFTLAYSAVGLSPDGGSTYFLPRLVGLRRAKELMLTNRLFGPEEALAYGVIDRVVKADELVSAAEAQAEALAKGPKGAIAAVKRLLAASPVESLESQMELESRSIATQMSGAEAKEGIAAFFEKRPAKFPH